jgi:carboxypeptidase Taq
MPAVETHFSELRQSIREVTYLKSTMAALEWDQQTKMPPQGAKYRAEQTTFLAGELHRRQTNPRLMELLGELSQDSQMADRSSDFSVTIRELKRECEKKAKLPETLVKELASTTSLGQQVWIEARKENDFGKFAPVLEKIFELKRQECEAIGYSDQAYDVLLDDYEPATSTRQVEAVLNSLKDELVPLVAEIAEAKQRPDESLLRREFPVEAQKKFGRIASEQIGFDYQQGRLDIAHHPFCTELGPSDTRITTRYDRQFFSSSFFGTLHEAGHGIYEQGLRSDQYGMPPGKYCSLGIHESQSRMWENLVGRSRGFWDHYYATAQELFPESLGSVALDDFFSAINAVRPSLIRVEADEATYNLHIIIRFQLEKALINDELSVADLPNAWNEKYREFLGIEPETDADGVMQDIHWSAGLVGYFATYTLGNIYASQMFDAAEKELGDLSSQFAKGEFAKLKNWLNENVHQCGQTYRPDELIQRITSEPLNHANLMKHLHDKLAPIYGF